MKHYFLVDYENVKEKGLEGFFSLRHRDTVYVFYSVNQQKISMDFVQDLRRKRFMPHMEYIYVRAGKQSLDMQLVSFLGYLISEHGTFGCDYTIISSDRDFMTVLDFWNHRLGKTVVYEFPSIDRYLKKDTIQLLTAPEEKKDHAGSQKVTGASGRLRNSSDRSRRTDTRRSEPAARAQDTEKAGEGKKAASSSRTDRSSNAGKTRQNRQFQQRDRSRNENQTGSYQAHPAAASDSSDEASKAAVTPETEVRGSEITGKDAGEKVREKKPFSFLSGPDEKEASSAGAADEMSAEESIREEKASEGKGKSTSPRVKAAPSSPGGRRVSRRAEALPVEKLFGSDGPLSDREASEDKDTSVAPVSGENVPAKVSAVSSENKEDTAVRPSDEALTVNATEEKPESTEVTEVSDVQGEGSEKPAVKKAPPKKKAASRKSEGTSSEKKAPAKSTGSASKEKAQESRASKQPVDDKTALNNSIQQTLAKAGVDAKTINDITRLVLGHMEEKNFKQVVYREMIKKYRQADGLRFYRTIQPLLEKR